MTIPNAMEVKLAVVVFAIAISLHNSRAADEHTLRTYGSSTKYLKSSRNGPVRCSSGESGALRVHILETGLTANRGQTSFHSADDRRYYIRSDTMGQLSLKHYSQPDWDFEKHGSFTARKNYFKSGTVSYESIVYRTYFLACHDGTLVLRRPTSDTEKSAASFIQEKVDKGPEDDKWTPCSRTCGGGRQTSKQRSCIGTWCAQPVTRRCNTQKCTDPCKPDPCAYGDCIRSGSTFSCDCFRGYTGRLCDQEVDPCRPNPCHNNGHCSRRGSDYTCYCDAGFSGKNCEIVDHPCKPNPCQNSGQCARLGGTEYRCNCAGGFTGRHCETSIDPCEPNPCKNNGDCYKRGSGYVCYCDAGFSGKNCEIAENPCKPNPCQNGGQCNRLGGTEYRCNCQAGFTGRHCETSSDPCTPNPCQNNGDCYKRGSGYVCYCDAGFSGKNCEKKDNPCQPNPCENGGQCNRLGGTEYRCKCPSGFTGHNCQTSTGGGGGGRCTSEACKNGGTCVETASGYVCNCKMGWHGKTCTNEMERNKWTECSRTCGGGTRYRPTCSSSSGNVNDCPRVYEDCNLEACPKASCKSSEQHRFNDNSRCCNKAPKSCGDFSRKATSRVFGGKESTRAQWPWMAAIIYTVPSEPIFFCGGAIIHKDWVLTAAHCANLFPADELEILVGANTRSKPEPGHKRVKVSEVIVHPDFENPKHDVGLYKLKTSLSFNSAFIKPICLPYGEKTPVELECFIAGWGVARKENIPDRITEDRLQHVGINRQPLDACVQGYKGTQFEDYINKEVLCAGYFGGNKDSCTGDSGGALVCQRKDSCDWYVAGITSFGPDDCGAGDIPGGYVDVVYYEDWIQQQISNG